MTDLTQAARQALEALAEAADYTRHPDYDWPAYFSRQVADAITALRAALQPTDAAEDPCCGEYERCTRPCTPRGQWLGERKARAALEAQQEPKPAAWQERVELSPGEFSEWFETRSEWNMRRPREVESGGVRYQFRPLYAAPQPAKVEAQQESALKVGNLPTYNRDDYPGLGMWWVQLWAVESDDKQPGKVVARAYGATPQEARQIAERLAAGFSAPQPAIPPGFVLVPEEPTPEMVAAGVRALYEASVGDFETTDSEVRITYSAMLAARPQPCSVPGLCAAMSRKCDQCDPLPQPPKEPQA
jgi:hypothetical protein